MGSPRCFHRPVLALTLIALVLPARAEEAAPPAPASVTPPAPATPSLSTLADQGARQLPAGGLVAAEITPTSITYASAGTFAPREGIAPEKVVFEIGSITKIFTGLLLAHAVIEGKAALTDPIAKHLPSDLTLRPGVAAITLQQLATHTSGLPALPANFKPVNLADPYADYTVEQLYAYLRDYDPAKPAPQPHSYSNIGFGLLGHLLGRIYDRPWAQLVREKITDPLGMDDTVVELDAERAARFAVPYSGTQRVLPWHLPTLGGAGALRSTAADLSRFAQALLTGRPEALNAAWDLTREPRFSFQDQGRSIGLAIMIGGRDGKTFYNHGGGTGGFRAHLEIVPGERAIVVLANNDSIEPGGLAAARLRPRAPAVAAPPREEQPIVAEQLAEFPGVYALGEKRSLTFVLDDEGRLRARLTGQPFLPVFFAGGDRFFARSIPVEFQFGRDAAGQIASVALLRNGSEMRAERTAAAPPKVLFPSVDKLREYAGNYQLQPGVVFEVTPRGGTLAVKLTGQSALPVFNDAPDHFVYEVVEAALTFERGANGTVTGLILHQNGEHRAARLPAETK